MTSPRSAEEIDLNTPASRVKRQKRNLPRCVANIVGLKSVTACSIAYVAVQAGSLMFYLGLRSHTIYTASDCVDTERAATS